MKSVGRPGKGRAKGGRVRAAIRPELKDEIEELVAGDIRIRSVNQLIETSLDYYLRDYQLANGDVGKDLFPILKKK